MTADEFRQLALGIRGSVEASHMGHPDFRINARIFASLGYPDGEWGTILLTPEQQRGFVVTHPDSFSPVKGYWGEKGATQVRLALSDPAAVDEALSTAARTKASGGAATRRGKANRPPPK